MHLPAELPADTELTDGDGQCRLASTGGEIAHASIAAMVVDVDQILFGSGDAIPVEG